MVSWLADCTLTHVWFLSKLEACFASADGSNSFLKVSSISGSIDVYVGDGGTADLHSEDGKYGELMLFAAQPFLYS